MISIFIFERIEFGDLSLHDLVENVDSEESAERIARKYRETTYPGTRDPKFKVYVVRVLSEE